MQGLYLGTYVSLNGASDARTMYLLATLAEIELALSYLPAVHAKLAN